MFVFERGFDGGFMERATPLLDDGECSYILKKVMSETATPFSYRRLQVRAPPPDVETILEREAILGRKAVKRLPRKYLAANHGKYLAITLSGKVLALAVSIEALSSTLAKAEPRENYYICRIGFRSVCEVP